MIGLDEQRLSVPEAAAYSGMSEAWIRKALSRKILRRCNIGRRVFVLKADLLAQMKISDNTPNGAGEAPRLVA